MKRKAVSLGIAGVITIIFLLLVLFSKGCAFNIIPYLIHDSISKDGGGEATFIRAFDVLFGGLIFWIIYRLICRLIKNEAN
jgi:uncharacterized membrane-anchored protein